MKKVKGDSKQRKEDSFAEREGRSVDQQSSEDGMNIKRQECNKNENDKQENIAI